MAGRRQIQAHVANGGEHVRRWGVGGGREERAEMGEDQQGMWLQRDKEH